MRNRFLNVWFGALVSVIRTAWRMPVLNFGALVAFGILIPRRYGFGFLDIRLILAYAFIPMLFVAPAVTAALRPGAPARGSAMELYAWIGAIVCYGWLIGLAVMALGLATVNYIFGPPELLLPDPGVLPAYVLFSFAAVAAVASLGAYVALLFSPRASLNTLRFGFLALLLFFYLGTGMLPLTWQMKLAGAFTSDGFGRTAIIVSATLLAFAAGLLRAMRSQTG